MYTGPTTSSVIVTVEPDAAGAQLRIETVTGVPHDVKTFCSVCVYDDAVTALLVATFVAVSVTCT